MNLDERMKYATMKARHKKELRPWYKKGWGIVLIFFGIIALIVVTIFSLMVIEHTVEKNNPTGASDQDYSQEMADKYREAINRSDSNALGPVDAPITIVEFADFPCSFCSDSHESLKNIREKYSDKVRIIYRDLPLHENSVFLALSARCAGEQEKFWQMHDLFYENQDRFNVSQTELRLIMPEIALALGLDDEKFQNCLTEEKYFPQIKQDVDDATFLNIEGTPTWFINNFFLTGHLPSNELENLVEGALRSLSLPQKN
jgi:protein-disulfide isomerase